MKKQFPGFILGFLCAILLFGLSVSGSALITARTTIEVEPINVMVNGEVFQPRNAQGEPVDVFVYNGTTYAPLRALAEAYGLVVGYDEEKNLATVDEAGSDLESNGDDSVALTYDDWSEEEEAKYQEFKGAWEVTREELDNYTKTMAFYDVSYGGPLSKEDLLQLMNDDLKSMERYSVELNTNSRKLVTVDFYFQDEHIARGTISFGKFLFSVR